MTDQSNTYVEAIDCDAKGGDGWIRKIDAIQAVLPITSFIFGNVGLSLIESARSTSYSHAGGA